MTHKAVSSISEDSGKWLGEIPTDQIGVWLDYALLLVSFSISDRTRYQEDNISCFLWSTEITLTDEINWDYGKDVLAKNISAP